MVTDSHTRPLAATTALYLYWIPLGAGGAAIVRFNGRMYETIKARREGRRPLDLYHTAVRGEPPDGGPVHYRERVAEP